MQDDIVQKAVNGHSLLILGQSGTGKSFVCKEIARKLKEKCINVRLTATTGIASLNIGGQTVHSWCGIGDGRYSNENLLDKISNNEHFLIYKNNILTTDCLIIDEISMLSKRLFEQLEYICRKTRKSEKIFGGIQVLGVGDFFQLAPVPDILKDDPGEYCFVSDIFKTYFIHKFVLTDVMRQNQPDFIKAVNDVSRGNLPDDTLNLIKRLSRPLPPGEEPIHLCARNFDCFIFNACKLMEIEGDDHVFHSVDEGDTNKLERMPVPKTLHLKIGCSILLLKNLSDKLVNGLRGTVVKIDKTNKTVGVNFQNKNFESTLYTELRKETFTVFSTTDNKVVATRRQLPLCLAFAITIHKSQGLTLSRLEVDASCIFAAGQFGVAIGRATEKKGLRIMGFNPSCVIKHEKILYDFYDDCVKCHKNFFQDTTCCKIDFVPSQTEEKAHPAISIFEEGEELSDFSDTEIEEIDFLMSSDSDVLDPEEQVHKVINMNEICSIFSGEKVSPREKLVSSYFKSLTENRINTVETFSNKLFHKFSDIFQATCGNVKTVSTDSKIWTAFCTELYNFSVSAEYTALVHLISDGEPSDIYYEICSNIFDKVKSLVIEKQSEHLTVSKDTTGKEISESVKGKLRYIFGRCVAKCRYHHMKHAKNNMYNKKSRISVGKAFLKVKMLDSLTTSYADLENNSEYKESLFETQRKQNLSQGLTNIIDSAFLFVQAIEKERLSVQTESNFKLYGTEFLNHCHSVLLENETLFNKWRILFQSFEQSDKYLFIDKDSADHCLRELYSDIIQRFCRVADNQFRKDFIHKVGKIKTDALRKRVDVKSTLTSELNIKAFCNDKSANKLSTHLKLKSFIFDHGMSSLKNFTKTDLIKLVNAYGIEFSKNDAKDSLKKKLCLVIRESDSMHFPHYLTTENPIPDTIPVPPPSTSDSPKAGPSVASAGPSVASVSVSQPPNANLKKRKKRSSKYSSKKKSAKKTHETETICPLCNSVYKDGEDWIACDLCDRWYDRKCIQVSETQWNEIEESDWFCPECLK